MKRPAFQFYPKDWRGNLKLRRCSDAAKGAWIEILCFLHDSEEYGVARFPLKELVSAVGVKLASARELVDKGVLKGGDTKVSAYVYVPRHAGKDGTPVTLLGDSAGPMWYSSRFVRDEYKRKHAGADTRFKATKPPGWSQPDLEPTRREGGDQGDGSAVASASAVSLSNTVSRNDRPLDRSVDNPEGRSSSTPKAAAHSTARADRQLDEQRRAAEHATAPPDAVMERYRKVAHPGESST